MPLPFYDFSEMKSGDKIICIKNGPRHGKLATVVTTEREWIEDISYYDDELFGDDGYYESRVIVQWEDGCPHTTVWKHANYFMPFDAETYERMEEQARREAHANKYL